MGGLYERAHIIRYFPPSARLYALWRRLMTAETLLLSAPALAVAHRQTPHRQTTHRHPADHPPN